MDWVQSMDKHQLLSGVTVPLARWFPQPASIPLHDTHCHLTLLSRNLKVSNCLSAKVATRCVMCSYVAGPQESVCGAFCFKSLLCHQWSGLHNHNDKVITRSPSLTNNKSLFKKKENIAIFFKVRNYWENNVGENGDKFITAHRSNFILRNRNFK